MKYLATAFFLLTMMMITVSCSKDDGNNVSTNSSAPREKGEKDDQGEKNNKGNKNDIYNVGQYEYYGTWKINDSTVVADDFGWLWYEYCSQIPDSYIDPYHPNSFGICFSTQIDPYVSYQEFPIKPLVHHFFPEADIAHVVFATQISGGPIVAHQAIDHIRHRERVSFVSINTDDVVDEDSDIGEMPSEILTRMIGRLPANYRVVLNLYVFERLTHYEIAQLLGIKEKTSSSLFFRAKQLLKKMANDYLNE